MYPKIFKDATVKIALGKTYTLKEGQSLRLQEDNIEFKAIDISYNECSNDAMCIRGPGAIYELYKDGILQNGYHYIIVDNNIKYTFEPFDEDYTLKTVKIKVAKEKVSNLEYNHQNVKIKVGDSVKMPSEDDYIAIDNIDSNRKSIDLKVYDSDENYTFYFSSNNKNAQFYMDTYYSNIILIETDYKTYAVISFSKSYKERYDPNKEANQEKSIVEYSKRVLGNEWYVLNFIEKGDSFYINEYKLNIMVEDIRGKDVSYKIIFDDNTYNYLYTNNIDEIKDLKHGTEEYIFRTYNILNNKTLLCVKKI